MIISPGIKQTVQLIVALICGAAILGFGLWVNSLHRAAQVGAQRGTVIETTAGVVGDGQKDDAQRDLVETAVTTGREEYKATIEKAKRDEPEVADRSERRVPRSVRQADRARRLARERSARAEGERGEEPQTADTPQR